MNRAIHHFLWLTVIASADPIGAQVPATAPTQPIVIAIPKTRVAMRFVNGWARSTVATPRASTRTTGDSSQT